MTKPLFAKKSGIYQIRNIVNGKIYVGQTTDLATRRYGHFRLLEENQSHNPHLQNAYNKYGKDSFVFEVLIFCDVDMLDRFEQETCNRLHPEYNIRKEVTSNRGHKVSEETKRKISAKHKGIPKSDEVKEKISRTLMGHKNSDLSIELSRQRLLGNKWNIGRKQSQEEKDRRAQSIRNAWKGRKRITPVEIGRKISAALKASAKALRGEKNHKSVLTTKDVVEIRHLCNEGIITKAEAARRFGVSQTSIGHILKGRTWKHVP